MLVTLTFKKKSQKEYASKYVKNYLRANQNIVDVLKHSISCKNWGFEILGRL